MQILLRALGALAGLFGATGVTLAAVGAHLSGAPTVTTAAYFLLFHAGGLAALVAIAGSSKSRLLVAATSLIAIGAILFSGDLALRALAHVTLVHMAAPTGGVLMILGWLVTACALPACIGQTQKDDLLQ